MTFQSGQSGNPNGRPRGAQSKRTQLAKLLEPHAEDLVAKTIELALAGDVNALRLCIERLIPKIQRESINISLPKKLDQRNLFKLRSEILQAALDGRISLEDAERLKRLIIDLPNNGATDLCITTNDPVEAAKIYQQIMMGQ